MIAEGFYFPYRTKNNSQYISINQINDVKNNILLQPGLKWEANAMVSSDGEVVPYERPVYLDGPVEVN